MGRNKVKIYEAIVDGEHALELKVMFLHAIDSPKLSLVLPQHPLDMLFLGSTFLLPFCVLLKRYLIYSCLFESQLAIAILIFLNLFFDASLHLIYPRIHFLLKGLAQGQALLQSLSSLAESKLIVSLRAKLCHYVLFIFLGTICLLKVV